MPATLAQRMWSTLFDSLAMVLWLVLVTLVQPWPESAPGWLKAAVWFVPPFLVEPTSVWLVGSTAGQSLVGLRVLSTGHTTLGPGRLYARHFTKLALLGVSPLYVPFSRRGQAIHDVLFGTSVIAEPIPRDLSLPVAEPFLWRQFISALLVAGLSAYLVGIVLAVLLELSGVRRSPPSFLGATFELCISFAMSGVFLSTVVHRGQRARARVPDAAIRASHQDS